MLAVVISVLVSPRPPSPRCICSASCGWTRSRWRSSASCSPSRWESSSRRSTSTRWTRTRFVSSVRKKHWPVLSDGSGVAEHGGGPLVLVPNRSVNLQSLSPFYGFQIDFYAIRLSGTLRARLRGNRQCNVPRLPDWRSAVSLVRVRNGRCQNAGKLAFSQLLVVTLEFYMDFGVGMQEAPAIPEILDTWDLICATFRSTPSSRAFYC